MSNRRKAVLYVIDGLEFGGGERVFAQLAQKLTPYYRIVVAANEGGVFEQHIRQTDADFCAIDLSCRFSLKPVFQILRLAREYHIDILHSQGARADFFCRVAGRLARTPHIICTIAMPVEGFNVSVAKKIAYRFADRVTQGYVKRFIVVSEALRKLLVEKRGLNKRKVVRIYNGIELDRYVPSADGADGSETEPVFPDEILVGCFGRLVWQKGIEFLIQAIPSVACKVDDTRFVIIGDGPERSSLEKMAGEKGVGDRLTFIGFADDVRPWLSRVSVVVIPSVQEGFPMITLEAMAMAKPIVATNIAGIDEQLRHERSALLVPARSPVALSDAIVSLLHNRPLAEELGRTARITAMEKFSLESTIHATKQLYDALQDSGQKTRMAEQELQ